MAMVAYINPVTQAVAGNRIGPVAPWQQRLADERPILVQHPGVRSMPNPFTLVTLVINTNYL